MTESEGSGFEFWQNCQPPTSWVVKGWVHEAGTVYQVFVDPGGVEYRRVSNNVIHQKLGLGAFVWQRKMWRMKT